MLPGEMPLLGKSGGRLGIETAESGERNNVEWFELTAARSSGSCNVNFKMFRVALKTVVVDPEFKNRGGLSDGIHEAEF